MLTTIQIIGLILFFVLIAQWVMAFICLMRLYKNKPIRLKLWQWNIIVLFAIIVGPVLYLTLEKPNPRFAREPVKKDFSKHGSECISSKDKPDEGDDYNI